ncbi:glycoside hydrolase domain-containing protein [Pedobacter sp. JCM 36344]|uniref:glycoside hydrolase domain-containing protein n=1 Tax=Pedobacter sp. JCM 36344 TaxID=3374280 RepID=UPI00397CB67E
MIKKLIFIILLAGLTLPALSFAQQDLIKYVNTLQGTDSNYGLSYGSTYPTVGVMDKLYNATEKGFPGDEDQGQMSSWYVISALGLYSVCPGTDEYVIGSPVFRKASITLEDGKRFIIDAKKNSKENVYIQSAKLNGKPLSKNFIRYKDIAAGGVLGFVMGPAPAKHRGTAEDDRPFSVSETLSKK